MRDSALLTGAVVLGGIVAPSLMFVGVPMASMGLAGLLWMGRTGVAVFAATCAVALGTFLVPEDAVLLAPVFMALLFAVARMHVQPALRSVAALTFVIAVAAVGADVVRAWRAGTTLLLMRAEVVEEAMKLVTTGARVDLDAAFGLEGPSLVDMMVQLWPADYFTNALLTAVVAVGVAGWAAARSGRAVNRLPAVADLDVTPHVLWAFVGGLLLLAASRVSGGMTGLAFAAGMNLMIMVRLPLLAQGLGVAASFYRRIGVGRFARYIGYASLLLIEMLAPVVSLLGLADFWVNFRKLPRDGDVPDGVESRPDGG